MNPTLFYITLMISCPPETVHQLEKQALIEQCTVEEIISEVLAKRIVGECTCKIVENSKRDEDAVRRRALLEKQLGFSCEVCGGTITGEELYNARAD